MNFPVCTFFGYPAPRAPDSSLTNARTLWLLMGRVNIWYAVNFFFSTCTIFR